MSGSRPEHLLNELEFNAKASGNKPLERRLADLTVWYYKNRERVPPDNLAARYALLDKAFWISLEVGALLTERIHGLEGEAGRRHLWTPRGVGVNGDLRKFG